MIDLLTRAVNKNNQTPRDCAEVIESGTNDTEQLISPDTGNGDKMQLRRSASSKKIFLETNTAAIILQKFMRQKNAEDELATRSKCITYNPRIVQKVRFYLPNRSTLITSSFVAIH